MRANTPGNNDPEPAVAALPANGILIFDRPKDQNRRGFEQPAKAPRFRVLDSWRGICACMVAMFHFSGAGPLGSAALIRHADLFVDFFFVLSGFVIFLNYGRRLTSFKSLRGFFLLRLGRVYPLHSLMLAVMIVIGLVRVVLPGSNMHLDSFVNGNHLPASIFIDGLLLQSLPGLGLWPVWNVPSWSVSAEFLVYVAFGLWMVLAGVRKWLVPAVLLLPVAAYAFSGTNPFPPPLIRSVAGFAFGCIVYRVYTEIQASGLLYNWSSSLITGLEAIALVMTFEYVRVGGGTRYCYFAPYVFAVSILIFAFEKGIISRFLGARVMVTLGSLSYSIYMTHWAVQYSMGLAAAVFERRTASSLLIKQADGSFVWGSNPVQGTTAYLVMLALTIALSVITYRYIETPGRDWARRAARRIA